MTVICLLPTAIYHGKRLFPAKSINGRMVEGVKSVAPAMAALSAVIACFGKKRVKTFTHSDIETYKPHRPEQQDEVNSLSHADNRLTSSHTQLQSSLRTPRPLARALWA